MTTMATEQPQTAFDEAPLEKQEIIDLLETWQTAKEDVDEARMLEKNAEEAALSQIDGLELEEGTYRAGRFVVKVSRVAAHYRIAARIAKTKSKT